MTASNIKVGAVVTWLEMRSPAQHRRARALPDHLSLRREPADSAASVAAALYLRVGMPWQWTDRREWTVAQWRDEMTEARSQLWIAREGSDVVGYFQLRRRDSAAVIQYFGLVPEHLGRGLGGPLLSAAIDHCWALKPTHVELNTCTLDHPHALPNYLARGFTISTRGMARSPSC